MAPPTKTFTIIPDASIDPDSPLTTTLMTQLRDNDQNVAAQIVGEPLATTIGNAQAPHTHDGTDSSLIEAGNLVFLEQHESTANETSFIFSSTLDGDTDETYVMIFRWQVASGGAHQLRFDPNNSGNNINITDNAINWQAVHGAAAVVSGRSTLHVKRTVQTVGQRITAASLIAQSGGTAPDAVGSVHSDSVAGTAIGANITSLQVLSSGGSSIGKGSTFALYRVKQS